MEKENARHHPESGDLWIQVVCWIIQAFLSQINIQDNNKSKMGKAPASSSMDRGSSALKSHVQNCEQMEIRQTRRGWLQEILGCDAKTEFKYFIGGNQIATSIEDTDCFCRMCCNAIHPFKMVVKELNTDAEMVSVDRPLACAVGGCKCCCYQEATFTSGGQEVGKIKEECWYWWVDYYMLALIVYLLWFFLTQNTSF